MLVFGDYVVNVRPPVCSQATRSLTMDQPAPRPSSPPDLQSAAYALVRCFEQADPEMPIECWNAVWLLTDALERHPSNLRATATGLAYEFQHAHPQLPMDCWNSVWQLANLVVPASAPPFTSW